MISALGVILSRATDAALVVVGSRGRGAVAGALFGSFSREVAREAPCPVVVVPPGAVGGDGWLDESREGSSSVVYGIADGESSADGLRVAAVLAAALGDRLVVVQEDGAGEEMLDDLSAEVERVDYDGALAPGLEAIAEAERARLVAVSGSVGGLARHARAPLMVVPGGLEPGGLSAALGLARAG